MESHETVKQSSQEHLQSTNRPPFYWFRGRKVPPIKALLSGQHRRSGIAMCVLKGPGIDRVSGASPLPNNQVRYNQEQLGLGFKALPI